MRRSGYACRATRNAALNLIWWSPACTQHPESHGVGLPPIDVQFAGPSKTSLWCAAWNAAIHDV